MRSPVFRPIISFFHSYSVFYFKMVVSKDKWKVEAAAKLAGWDEMKLNYSTNKITLTLDGSPLPIVGHNAVMRHVINTI